MLLLEALKITQSTPELQVNLVDTPLEEAGQFKGIPRFLLGILGLHVVRFPLPQVFQLCLQSLQLVLVLLDNFVAEVRPLG